MARASYEKGGKIKRWERKLDRPTEALKQIGALMTAESQAAFKNQKLGKISWRPRSVPNIFGIIADFAAGKKKPPKRRFEPRPALRDTGRLSASIAFQLKGSDVVEVGTNLDYAGVLHAGGRTKSKPISEKVQDALAEWLPSAPDKIRQRLRFLLRPQMRGRTLKAQLPARPIVGITVQTRRDVAEAVRVKIFEVK